jgi:hypothetical protein
MLDREKEIRELVLALIDSTAIYVANRIENDKNKSVYINSISRCYAICDNLDNEDSLHRMRLDLLEILRHSINNFSVGFEIFSNVKKYHIMGIEQSLDIVESLLKRFDGHHPYADIPHRRSILVYGYKI